MALFPQNPANNQQMTVNGITYVYNSSLTAWVRYATFLGNVTANNGTFFDNVAVTNNITSAGNMSASGNITGGNLSGTLLTGTLATAAQPNITSVGTLTSLTLSSTGNLTAGNLIGVFANGTSNVRIPTASGNINFSSAGNANILIVTGTGANIAGTLSITGNASVSNLAVNTTPSLWAGVNYIELPAAGMISAKSGGMYVQENIYYTNAGNGNFRYSSNGFASQYTQISGFHQWNTAANGVANANATLNERMRIDNGGNLLVATTSTSAAYAGASWRWLGYQINSRDTTADTNQIVFYNPNGAVGYINTNGSATVFGTSSDYRLKENAQPMTGALAKILSLNPVTYTWKVDGSAGQGFIAHELAAVVPECVSGEKDAVDAEGNPKYQGVDTSFLVATLTAAIKEQQVLIQAMSARIAALEAK
jgi:hypothetical protein